MLQEAQSPISPVQQSSYPNRWWQWVVLYPTFFLGILGNIPQLAKVSEAWGNYGIPLFSSTDEREQAKYWLANTDCMEPLRSLTTHQPDELSINVMLCPKTGDMLVSLQDANPNDAKKVKPVRRWVKVANDSENALSSFLMPSAIAATVPNFSEQMSQSEGGAIAQVTVLCQKLLEDNQILRRLKYADGRCVDEVVNTLTGEVISQTASTQYSAGC
ncbi:MAG: hypothetical protein HY785_08920 [Oscillatoriophycideae cyanobacterium NC_groundwater_1537_Pr4_S-0.65um_50_18]|nr:hypothetical protein [Candidatus Woesearchaeota archaeon]MBI4781436.1 hypothetical protein [Oscillatoriophycideae cyanobacterium NC_groundwater_1537_Pr4_S-0.65um_50_18]